MEFNSLSGFDSPEITQTSVDQCMVSNKFQGIKSIDYEVLDGYMATEIKPVSLLTNDFDHAPLLIKIELDESPYRH